MKRKQNSRGMTLVELLVSLLIMVTVITLAGTMLLSVQSFYMKSTDRGLDKISAESVYRIANEKLTYATQIVLSRERKLPMERGGWQWITVDEKGRFILNGTDIYGEEYYHGKTLSMEVYADSFDRLYLQVALNKNGKTYETASFLQAMNIRAAAQWDTEMPDVRKAISAKDSAGAAINKSNPIRSESGMYIYFENELERIYTGTVADEIYRRTVDNTAEYQVGASYKHGTFVWYQGSWWLARKDDSVGGSGLLIIGPPGTNDKWKKIQMECATQDYTGTLWKDVSHYDKDDVVSYQGKYYRSLDEDNLLHPMDPRGKFAWREVVRDEENSTDTVTKWKWAVPG